MNPQPDMPGAIELLYYRASFAPAYSRNPDEKKCRIRLA